MTVTVGRDLENGFDDACDVVVVGSGAGGAVVAAICAEAGLDVVVVEEGGHYPHAEYSKFRPSETIRRLGRESGMTAVVPATSDTPTLSLMQGKCVGGSSIMTGGVCFRVPEDILAHWARDLGLPDMAPDALAPFFEEVEEAIHVEDVPPEARSRGTELFVAGADKLGIEIKSLRRNTKGCEGRARCTFGCPVKAKLSVDVSYLPRAFAAGARLYADCRVDDVIVENGRAAGVRGVVLGGKKGKPTHRFRVDAKIVFVCAGTIHTPLVLWRAGLGKRCHALGRHVTLHPSFRLNAVFDEPVRGWDGAMQSVYSDQFMDDGLTLINVYSAPNVLAAAFPGIGKEHLEHIEKMPYTAMFGGMIHDTAEGEWGGTIYATPMREPIFTYKMDPDDRRRFLRGFLIVAEIAFAAGAREVMLPWFGVPAFKSMSAIRDALASPPPMSKIESMTFHPLGSARMACNDRLGVVKTTGESWELPGLFVADGSVLPTSIGVNSQLPIMTVATKIARGVVERWSA